MRFLWKTVVVFLVCSLSNYIHGEARCAESAEASVHGENLRVQSMEDPDPGCDVVNLVADLNIHGSSYPASLEVYDGKLFFRAQAHNYSNYELFQYDLSSISQVAEISPLSAYPDYLTEMGGKLYFSAQDGVHGIELWAFDGIQVSLIADIRSGSASSSPKNLFVHDNQLFFSANDGVSGEELWMYDGLNPPVKVADIRPGSSSSTPSHFCSYDGALFFSANNGTDGVELWKFDGSVSEVADINQGTGNGNPDWLRVYDGKLYFSANDGSGTVLWSFDGVSASMAANVSGPSYLEVFDGDLYFGALSGNVKSVFKYDGVTAAPLGPDMPQGWPRDLVVFNNELFFSGPESVWKTDGNTFVELPGTFSSISELTVFGSHLYFAASGSNDDYDIELWRTDGTSSSVVQNLNTTSSSIPQSMVEQDGDLHFIAFDGNGSLIMRYDGCSAFSELNLASASDPTGMASFGGALYFNAKVGGTGNELWTYDGTVASQVSDIRPGSGDANPNGYVVFDNVLYFQANDGSSGPELWAYDGVQPPVLVADIYPGTTGSFPQNMCVFDNKLVFMATDNDAGSELWVLDGQSPPYRVADYYPGTGFGVNSGFVEYNGKLYFAARSTSGGVELASFDGQTMEEVADIRPGSTGSFPANFVVLNGGLYFTANDGVHGSDWMMFDGVDVTALDVIPGSGGLSLRYPIAYHGAIYFQSAGDDFSKGTELWKYDGYALSLVADISPGTFASVPQEFIVFHDVLYFQANGLFTGRELYSCTSTCGCEDADQDGFTSAACGGEDCDDSNPEVHPGATEICDGTDNDCDGLIDDDDPDVVGLITWYADVDGDGYGNVHVTVTSCEKPDGYVGISTDCDDESASVYPEAPELPDGIDNDCDGLIDEGLSVLEVDLGGCASVLLGYAPEACHTLVPVVENGVEPYVFDWSTGEVAPTIEVCPEENAQYSVTVTDATGMTATSVITIQVIDVRCGNNQDKVVICHYPPGNPENGQELCISQNALETHLIEHGDVIGTCQQADPCQIGGQNGDRASSSSAGMQVGQPNGLAAGWADQSDNIRVFPVPADDDLQIRSERVMARIRLFTVSGIPVGDWTPGRSTVRLDVHAYPAGTYLLTLVYSDGTRSHRPVLIAR